MDKWKDDIEKYRAGKLTAAERHTLEKKALSDPFLADALEGVEEISTELFSSDVQDLNQKILDEKKNRWLLPMRIAASVIGIAVISTIIIYSNSDNSKNLASNQVKESKDSVALKVDSVNESRKQSGDTAATTESEVKSKEEPKKIDETLVAVLKESKPKSAKPVEEPITQTLSGAGGVSQSGKPTLTQVTPSEPSPVTDSIMSAGFASTTQPKLALAIDADDSTTEEIVITTAPVAESTPKSERSRKQSGKRSKVATNDASSGLVTSGVVRVVSGIVRDQQGQPIPGVNVIAKGSTIGTVTNVEGKYSIEVPGADQTLVYSFIGFEAQEQPVNKLKDGNLDVKMEEDVTQLSEVVVTGYGDKRDSSEPVVRLAEPDGGRKAYDQYLDEKKIYPQQAVENKVEGKVTIEFTVGITGVLSDFQVTRKLGYGCDEEVIRLVKEGPKWKPSYIDNEAVESLVRIKTKFKLPGK